MNTSDLFDVSTKYLKWYFELLEKHGKGRKLKGDYLERHHRYPRFAFGDNDDVVTLTFRCHFLAHLLIYKHAKSIGHPMVNKAFFPLHRMSSSSKNQHGSVAMRSRLFELVKREAANAMSGENNPFFGKTHTLATRELLSAKALGREMTDEVRSAISDGMTRWWKDAGESARLEVSRRMTGRIVTDATRAKISVAHAGKSLSEETKAKISAGNTGKLLGVEKSEEHCNAISAGLTGLKKTDEHVDKINRNPEKIAKTAEKHRGMKRSAETKAKISESKIGKPAANSGSITFYDPSTFERFKFPKDTDTALIPSHLIRGMGPGTEPKEPKVKKSVYYHPLTLETLRVPVGEIPPAEFIKGNPALSVPKKRKST